MREQAFDIHHQRDVGVTFGCLFGCYAFLCGNPRCLPLSFRPATTAKTLKEEKAALLVSVRLQVAQIPKAVLFEQASHFGGMVKRRLCEPALQRRPDAEKDPYSVQPYRCCWQESEAEGATL